MNHLITKDFDCQVKEIFAKLSKKKQSTKKVIEFLRNIGEHERADNISMCGTHVGITDVDGIAKILKADFCRERLCYICAWRRQARFIAQIFPVISILSNRGYNFLFATLTVKNVKFDDLENATNQILKGYEKLRHRRKVKRSWMGIVRSMELTYNPQDNTFHPHLHLLIAVENDYFKNKEKYIPQIELAYLWKECIDVDYEPIVDIRKVENTDKATVETLKYSLKPSNAEEAFSAFFYILKGRRLISFCGIFQKIRNELKFSDFENVLTDMDDIEKGRNISYNLYTFDATGGVYRFTEQFNITL